MVAARPDAPAARKPPRRPRAAKGAQDLSGDLTPVVGTNLRRLRVRRGLSLERLSQACGVSRAMLSQVELGRSAPTINVVWRIARALEVPFSALIVARPSSHVRVLRLHEAKLLASHDGAFTSRALFPYDEPRRVEFYELRLDGRTSEKADPHPPGTVENLVVAQGSVEVDVAGEATLLGPGDTIVFQADVPHAYRNAGASVALMYLVMTYAETVG